MRISFKWLQRYVDVPCSPAELARQLTAVGLEVESIDEPGRALDGFVVGEVLSVEKHPKADRLTVCQVRMKPSAQPVQIVCGAPNVRAGQKVAVGLGGAVVPHNQHDPEGKPFTLSDVTIRGVESHGMICSEYELGTGDDRDGILVLGAGARLGSPLSRHLGIDDTMYEIGVTPNRPDCLSHIGVAREAAALLGSPLKIPPDRLSEAKKDPTSKHVSVQVRNATDCPRYSARYVSGVKVGPSPEWMQSLLKAVDVRPINNVVDITNFVMYECGQPLHAFDKDRLAGGSIVVKSAAPGERFTTLDGKENALSGTTLMICDAERSVAIAGVMGGLNSEISETTTNVLIESAYFRPGSIRRTSRFLGASTDASQRFERGTDPSGTVYAANRAALLMAEFCGGTVHGGVLDVYRKKIRPKTVAVRPVRVNRILGTMIGAPAIRRHLSSIGISVTSGASGILRCSIPTFRPDIEQEIDLVEEIARLYGYNNIEDKSISSVDLSAIVPAPTLRQAIRRWLEGMGLREVVTNSMMEEPVARAFSDAVVVVKNPVSKDMSALRPSSVPSLLQVVGFNRNHGTEDLRLFELGRKYLAKERKGEPIGGYTEEPILSICLTGRREPVSWDSDKTAADIFDIKGIVESILRKIALDKFSLICYDSSSSLTDETVGVEINGSYAGFIGKVKPDLARRFGVECEVYVAELSLRLLDHIGTDERKFTSISRFPSVSRDLAFVVDLGIPAQELLSRIRGAGGGRLKEVLLFDVYMGSPLPPEKKSVAFSLRFNSAEKTLTDSEIGDALDQIVSVMKKDFDADLRAS